jgi:S-adenosylmethionine hydrolase
MSDPIITLSTDFGQNSPYVAAMKGVILGINPLARLVDLSHEIPPQDVRYAAFFLAEAVPFFPPQTLHVVVVDPGVGTDRALLYAESAQQRLLVPDNGAMTLLAARYSVKQLRRLTDVRYWRSTVSATFHGRDILAPVAGHLSLGLGPERLGPLTEKCVTLASPVAVKKGDDWFGEVLFVDRFGNLLTNLPVDDFPHRPLGLRIAASNSNPRQEFMVRRVRTYGEAPAGELVALISSGGWMEIAVVNGSAAQRLNARSGTPLQVFFPTGPDEKKL